jgi:hypothetical protein
MLLISSQEFTIGTIADNHLIKYMSQNIDKNLSGGGRFSLEFRDKSLEWSCTYLRSFAAERRVAA